MKDTWEQLADAVADTIVLLQKYEVSGWADRLIEINHRIIQRWPEGPILLLDQYGGMGSLTDVYICPENNHKIRNEDERDVNQMLQKLTSKMYALAKELER